MLQPGSPMWGEGPFALSFWPVGFFLELGSLLNSSEHLCYTVFLKSLENLFESNNLASTVTVLLVYHFTCTMWMF